MRLLIVTIILYKKGEKIEKLRQTKNIQKFSEIINLLKKIFNERPDPTDMPDLESEKSAELNKNQKGQELKILTPNQMLRRLPISLAQLKAVILKNLKTKLGSYCILCTDTKTLQNKSIKVFWSTLFKDGNNFYEQRKQ